MQRVGSSALWTEEHLRKTIVLVDMDCFYVQVEQRLNPDLKGKPCAVVQYNGWKGGGIIAVDYIARSKGVKRNGMRGDDAMKLCPEIKLCRVPEVNGKADLTRYRDACVEVINVLSQFGGRVERASVDEAYIDLTDVVEKLLKIGSYNVLSNDLSNTFIEGWTDENDDINASRESGVEKWCDWLKTQPENNCFIRLAIAGKIVEDIRAAVYQQTGFRCSAGISHNKMLAKLGCGLHKPNKQTIMPYTCIDKLFNTIKIGKIRHLGGKLGVLLCEKFQVSEIGQVQNIPLSMLIETFGDKTGNWLNEVCRGIDKEEVKERHIPQSIGCGKTFPGQACLNTREKVNSWCEKLMLELSKRLFKDKSANCRIAKTLTASVKLDNGKTLSRSCTIFSYETIRLTKELFSVLQQLNKHDSRNSKWSPGISSLNVSAKNFTIVSQSDTFKFQTLNTTGSKVTDTCTGTGNHGLKETSQTKITSTSEPDCKFTQVQPIATLSNKKNESSRNNKNLCQIDRAFNILFSPNSAEPTLKSINVHDNSCQEFSIQTNKGVLSQSTSRASPSKKRNKRKTSILGFLSPKDDSPLKKLKSEPKPIKITDDKTVTTQDKSNATNILPLGFFHRKSKFANAVKTALSDHKPSESTDIVQNVLPESNKDALVNITNGTTTSNEVFTDTTGTGFSLWSDFSDTELFCEKCDLQISPWEAPEHKSFHLALETGKIL